MMTDTTTAAPDRLTRPSRRRIVARWMVSFVGFPLGGLAAMAVAGPVDSPVAAVFGGLLTGAILGTAQAWGLDLSRPRSWGWIGATALGLPTGLALGAALVDYATSLSALVIQGAVSGLLVGGAQSMVLKGRLGRLVLGWPPALAASWALGWFITTSIGVEVDDRFTVFGSSGAVVVTALTAALPLVLRVQDGSSR